MDTTVFARFRRGLMVLVALVAAGLVAASANEVMRDRRQAEADTLRHAQNLAKTLELHAQGTFRTASMAAAALAEALTPHPGSSPPDQNEVRHLMARLLVEGSPVRSLAVTDAEGWVRAASASQTGGLRVADRDYFRTHQTVADHGAYISGPLISRVKHDWVINVSHRIDDADGRFAGIAWATIDLGRLERFYATLDVGAQGNISLWTPDGDLLARYPRSSVPRVIPARVTASIREAIEGQREGTLTGPSPMDGVNRIVAFRAVESLPLYVSVRVGEDDFLAMWRASAASELIELGCEVAVVLLLTVLLLRYIKRLESTAHALRESEQRARAIFDSTFQYMALLRPDGRMLAINRAGLEFGGGSFSEDDVASAIGCPAWKMRAWRDQPDSATRMRQATERAAQGALVRFEAELASNDGSRHTVDCSVKPVRDGDGNVVLLVAEARDITERKRIEDDLRRSEARLRSYLDAAMEGIVVTDGTGRFVDANPAACQMLGYSREDLLARGIRDVAVDAGTTAGGLPETHLTLLCTGEFRGGAALRRKDDAVRLVEINAVQLGTDRNLSVIRDVTERRLAEDALRASTARLAALMQALPDIALIIDAEGRYREVLGPRANALTMSADALVGRYVTEVLPPDVAARVSDVIARTLRTDEPQTIEFPLSLAAGRRWFEARTAALPRDFGPRPKVLVLARDVTERRLAAERLAQAKEQAESASRIKSNFLATMSHELRTPLNAIIGFSEIMVHQVFGEIGSPRYAEYARHIQQSGAHLLELINDVLDMSKLEAGRYALEEREVRLDEVLDACLTVSAMAAEAGGVALIPNLLPRLPPLRGDERAVRQVVLNLLSNAVKFTPAGGRVTLSAAVTAAGDLEITVADTGIGIDEAALVTITEPFQQADNTISRRFGGTGLGLAISRNLMELHGGTLGIVSAPDQGTVVTVRFPAERVVRAIDVVGTA